MDINATDEDGRTPLHYACEWGNEKIVRLLLKHDEADVTKCDKYQRNPLEVAVEEGQK